VIKRNNVLVMYGVPLEYEMCYSLLLWF